MVEGKPIIGLCGGIGAGKTFVGGLFAELGCVVIDSDHLVHDAYHHAELKQILREWWGPGVFAADGEVDRAAVARKIFSSEPDRHRLEKILHPYVAAIREARMRLALSEAGLVAFVWDSPLLFETHLDRLCDATVFIDAPEEIRLNRVLLSRGWAKEELSRREKSQMPLDKKRAISDYVLVNATSADSTRAQVRELLPRIVAGASVSPQNG